MGGRTFTSDLVGRYCEGFILAIDVFIRTVNIKRSIRPIVI